MITFKGKTAVITGSSDGIGFAIAKIFAAYGADLVIVGINPDKLAEKAHSLTLNGNHVLPVVADVSGSDQRQLFFPLALPVKLSGVIGKLIKFKLKSSKEYSKNMCLKTSHPKPSPLI